MTWEKGENAQNEAQRRKYGAGYSEEMRRRRSLRKNYSKPGGFAWLREHDPERFQQIIEANKERLRRGAKGQIEAESQDLSEIKDRTQEV